MSLEYNYAKQLAIYLWETHYRDDSPNWEPCGDLAGVLTQIDNMLVGLTRPCHLTVKVGAFFNKLKLLCWLFGRGSKRYPYPVDNYQKPSGNATFRRIQISPTVEPESVDKSVDNYQNPSRNATFRRIH